MSSDFVFIDPNKIPPRRSLKPVRFGKLKVKKISSKILEKDSYGEEYKVEEDVPEFSLLESVLPENNLAVQTSSIDPLSQAIFTLETTDFFISKNSVVSAPILKEKVKTQEDARKELLAELESIYINDEELSKKINELSSTSRSVPTRLIGSSFLSKDNGNENLKINIIPKQDFYKNFDENKEGYFPPANLTVKKDLTDKYRAENDWFQVSLATPARISELKKYSENKSSFRNSFQKIEPSKKERGSGFKTFLIFLSLFPISLGYLFISGTISFSNFASGSENLVKNALGGVNSKLLSTSGFTLVNSKESDIFPHLAEFNSRIKDAGLGKELSDNIESFLQKNAEFSWFNIFKSKSLNNVFSITEVETLGKVKNALNILSSNNKSLTKLSSEFSNYVSILAFWNQILLPDKNYLIVVLNSDHSWPGGGEPKNYVVVNTSKEGLETVSSGKFSELDAAFDLKVVPPDPIKVVSTSWLPSQSFWFMDFKESAKTLVNFFENTTNKKIDGVIAIDENFLKELSFKESLTLDTSSTSWFYSFYDAISRKPAGRWVSLSNILNSGLNSHDVQFYFKDTSLEKFVEGSGWSTKVASEDSKDVLGISWASIKGEALNLELAEYRTQIFQDGSVMVKLSLMARQNIGDESLNYLKIYLPKGFQVLKAEGFSAKEKIPEFNYVAKGFSLDSRVKNHVDSKFPSIDLFEEGNSGVVGGWVNLKKNERNTINLEYISATKISREDEDGEGSYSLKIIRPSQKENTPFRYVVTPQEGVKITSLEPNGFISENLGEYQGNISQDLNLTSSFLFNK